MSHASVSPMNSIGSKVAGTIIVAVFWFAFIVLYLAFFADAFNLWQKVAVFLASGAIAGGLIGVFWVKWALK
jgi:hypothetical protein